jgi:hypothetical protein
MGQKTLHSSLLGAWFFASLQGQLALAFFPVLLLPLMTDCGSGILPSEFSESLLQLKAVVTILFHFINYLLGQ